MLGRLDYGVLFRMEAAAELMTLSRRDLQFFTQTTDIKAMGNPGRGAVISRGKNVFVFDKECTHLPAQTGRASGYEMGDFHEIFIPSGTGHAAAPLDKVF
jgi:hypothetical protein